MFCFECGTELSENETLCSQCGTPVNTEDTPKEPPVEEATPAQEAPVDTEEPALEDVAEQEQPEEDATVSQDTLSLLLADVKESFHLEETEALPDEDTEKTDSEENAEEPEESTYARDLPGMADVDFSLLLFCKQIRQKVKVALSGECADEIFGGYPWFRDPDIRAIDGFPWSQNISQRIQLLNKRYQKDKECREYINSRYTDTINSCDILPGASQQECRMKQMMVLNLINMLC